LSLQITILTDSFEGLNSSRLVCHGVAQSTGVLWCSKGLPNIGKSYLMKVKFARLQSC